MPQNPKYYDLISHLNDAYGIDVTTAKKLNIGNDFNTSVYRATDCDHNNYFVKLRRKFQPASIIIPNILHKNGCEHVISPLKMKNGAYWGKSQESAIQESTIIVYPHINGRNAVDVKLTPHQWSQIGVFLKDLHTISLPQLENYDIPKETFSDQWHEQVLSFMAELDETQHHDDITRQTAIFLKSKHAVISELTERTKNLQKTLKNQPFDPVLCHSDLHGWNVMIDDHDLYIMDWDTIILAPKERDLMFIGGGIWDSGHTHDMEQRYFYDGYGPTNVNKDLILYYRFSRILQDLSEYYDHIFKSSDNNDQKHQSLLYLQRNFEENGTIACALRA